MNCAVCDLAFQTPRARATHEVKAHPGWRMPDDLRVARTRATGLRWHRRQPTLRTWIGWANANAGRHGRPRLPRNSAWPIGPCVYCGGAQTGWDHVVPFSKGGEHTIANLVPSCLSCNRRKGLRLGGPLPLLVDLICGWCWSPVQRRSSDLRGQSYVGCSRAHINAIRRTPLPFGTRAFSRRIRRGDGIRGYRVVEARPVFSGTQDRLAI